MVKLHQHTHTSSEHLFLENNLWRFTCRHQLLQPAEDAGNETLRWTRLLHDYNRRREATSALDWRGGGIKGQVK